jgi:hypothetical protein
MLARLAAARLSAGVIRMLAGCGAAIFDMDVKRRLKPRLEADNGNAIY